MLTSEINELEMLLRIWEDVNLNATLLHRLYKLQDENKLTTMKLMGKRLAGSDLSTGGGLHRPIPHYENFRKILEQSSNKDISFYEEYLPKIPKGYPVLGIAKSLLTFPLYVGQWLRSKKVVTLTADTVLEPYPILGNDTNFLSYLPYDSFLVSLPKPIVLAGIKKQVEFSKFICVVQPKEGLIPEPVIHIFCINSLLGEALIPENLKQKIKDHIGYSDGKFLKKTEIDINFFNEFSDASFNLYWKSGIDFSFGKDSGHLFLTRDLTGATEMIDVYQSAQVEKTGTMKLVYEKMLNYINGLGKIFFETTYGYIDPAELREILSGVDTPTDFSNSPEPSVGIASRVIITEAQSLKWNEVVGEHVCYIKTKKIKGKTIAVLVNGSEKSPHIRRGHMMNIQKSDGTFQQKWIKPMLVRKDKLGLEGIKGSELVMKL